MILWSREVRQELFETEEGRLLAERAFYEDGLTPNYMEIGADLIPRYGEYLLYSERERDCKLTSSNGTQKREAKKNEEDSERKE